MRIANEEAFGPVAAILPFDTEAEVVRCANATEMGLASYLYTNDLRRALRISEDRATMKTAVAGTSRRRQQNRDLRRRI